MKKVGKDIPAGDRWKEVAASYAEGIEGAYHRHRLRVIQTLLPDLNGRRVLDFGCGEGVMIAETLKRGAAQVTGIDIEPTLLEKARQRESGAKLLLGGVEQLNELQDNSFDCLLSLNVLAYLSNREEDEFYRQSARILVPGGAMVVTHSNSLFDIFTFNSYTVAFFRDQFTCDIAPLLIHPDRPSRSSFNIRENPLSYASKLAAYGFREERQEFMNRHLLPPLLSEDDPDDMQRERPETLDLPMDERWKLFFQCSMFASKAVRV
jgi:ubiquinone/menaquinone biosynthesis C-methylase UbiE